MNRQLALFLCIVAFLSTLFLIRYRIVGQAVYGDGIYYWSYTRSIVIDHDLNFKNEGAHIYGPVTNNNSFPELPGTTRTDLARAKYYPLGSSLLWLPIFAVIHSALQIAASLGVSVIANGYSDSYQITLGIINIIFIVLGLFLIDKLLRQFFPPFIAHTTSAAILFATNLLYYGSLDVLNSHPASFLLCSIFTYLFVVHKDKLSTRSLFGLGVVLGFMSLIRLQDSLFLLMPLFFITEKLRNEKKRTSSTAQTFALFAGACIGYFPQLLASKAIYHTFFLLPYTLGGGNFAATKNMTIQLFINTQKGLLFYSPLYIIGLIGLVLLKDKAQVLRLPFLFVIVAVLLLIGSWSGWSQGEAFGLRMLIGLLPLIAFGVAEVIRRMLLRFSKTTVLLITGGFILQNILMIGAFHLFFHNPTYIGNQLSSSGRIKIEILQKMQKL